MIASSQVYKVEGPKHISVPIDTNDADDLLRLDSLRAGFPGYSDIEQVSDRLLILKLYSGLATELLR